MFMNSQSTTNLTRYSNEYSRVFKPSVTGNTSICNTVRRDRGKKLAAPVGFEPTTYGSEARCKQFRPIGDSKLTWDIIK